MKAETMKNPINVKVYAYESDLHRLIAARLPEFVRGGRVNTILLGSATGNVQFTVYQWFSKNRLSPKAAKSLLAVAKGRIKPEELLPYVFA